MGRFVASVVLAAAVLAAGCRTVQTRRPISASGDLRLADPARAFEVLDGAGAVRGLVVLFRARGPAQDSLYAVRNVWHQDIGLIDAYGRAYRYLPHHREPSWVGSGTVLEGVERVLGIEDARLSALPFPPAEREVSPGELERRRAARPAAEPGERLNPPDALARKRARVPPAARAAPPTDRSPSP